jgi:predicted ArsR family transcriptional regulator
MTKSHTYMDMNQAQVANILAYVDETQGEQVKKDIFRRLGYECFHAGKTREWIASFNGDVEALIDWVNIERASTYWERLEFNDDRTMLILTGREVQGCACAFANCARPPQSLCHHCCKAFQQELFGKLLDQKVEVTITEAFLLGDKRCSTTIQLV